MATFRSQFSSYWHQQILDLGWEAWLGIVRLFFMGAWVSKLESFSSSLVAHHNEAECIQDYFDFGPHFGPWMENVREDEKDCPSNLRREISKSKLMFGVEYQHT